jgi:hypothetical protein
MAEMGSVQTNHLQFEELLGALCSYFEQELERQEMVLALCAAQGRAARAHDTEYLEANTEALGQLIHAAVRGEKERLVVVQALVGLLSLPPERQNLSSLVALATEPWSERLAFYQEQLQDVLAKIRVTVRENAPILRRSLRIVNGTLQTLEICASARDGRYDARGEEGNSNGLPPNLIDSKG